MAAHEIAKCSKPVSDGEFVQDCLVKVADILCPEQKGKLTDISLSKENVTWGIEDLSHVL